MSREQWKNLYHAFRWMRRLATEGEAIAWCAHFNSYNGLILGRVIR